jgi:hypothetical protein
VLDADAAGVWGAFVSLRFDADLGDELDLISIQELSWSSQARSARSAADLFEIENAAFHRQGPSNLSVTIARAVFATNPERVATDGDDIVSGKFSPDGTGRADAVFTSGVADPIGPVEAVVNFGTARVDRSSVVPVPLPAWGIGLAGGVLAAVAARRLRRRSSPT